jgi:MFS family permease
MIFSPVFGYFGDRSSRTRLIFIGVIFWCIFTVAGSFATV